MTILFTQFIVSFSLYISTIDQFSVIGTYCTARYSSVSLIDIETYRFFTVVGEMFQSFVSLLKTTMGLQRSFKQFIYLSILKI